MSAVAQVPKSTAIIYRLGLWLALNPDHPRWMHAQYTHFFQTRMLHHDVVCEEKGLCPLCELPTTIEDGNASHNSQ